MAVLRSWFNGSQGLNQVYYSTAGNFSKEKWVNAIGGLSDLVFIGTTESNTKVGGFTGNVTIPTEPTEAWLDSQRFFIFNLSNRTRFFGCHMYENVKVNTQTVPASLVAVNGTKTIAFGHSDDLQFKFENATATVFFTQFLMFGNFYPTPTYENMWIDSQEGNLAEFEVYQVMY